MSSCFCSSCVSSFSIMASPFTPPPSVPRTSSLIKGVYLGINLRPERRQNSPSRPGSASIRQPEAPRQHGARGRVGIMCSGVNLRAELLFSTKTIISTFPTIILIPRPITAVLPHVIILPLITFADFVASAAHLCCETILSSGCFGGGGGTDGNAGALTFSMFTLS